MAHSSAAATAATVDAEEAAMHLMSHHGVQQHMPRQELEEIGMVQAAAAVVEELIGGTPETLPTLEELPTGTTPRAATPRTTTNAIATTWTS